MEGIIFNNNQNIIDSYGIRPNLFYDIEGVLVGKNGNKLKVEKTIDDKRIYYSLRVNQELDIRVGQKVKIIKDYIVSMAIEEKEEELSIGIEDTINKLGLENTEEVQQAIENLIKNGIPIDRENLESYLRSKRYLKEIVNNLDFDSCIKLLEENIDLKEDSLQKISDALSDIKDERKFSIRAMLKLRKSLTYKEAEQIAEGIYGRKMGKDVYETIIALHKEKIPINKEKIEKVLEVMDKLYDVKAYDTEGFIKITEEGLPVNIENLYKVKHSYNNSKIDENMNSVKYEQFTIAKETSIEDILNILKSLDLEESQGNIQLVREFLINELELNRANFDKVISMKNALKELIDIADQENIACLIEEKIDPLKEEISVLVDKIINKEYITSELSFQDTNNILDKIEKLNTITDKELLSIIKSGENFKIENLKTIIDSQKELGEGLNLRVAEKAVNISNIFNRLGDLDSNTIALASKKFNYVTLNNLYESHISLPVDARVTPIKENQENLIRQEYLNIKSNTTMNLVRESINEGISIESIPLGQLNQYIDKKTLEYRKSQRFINELNFIKGKEESIIPVVMKNNLNMSLSKLNDINSILNSGKGIGNEFNNLVNMKANYDENISKEIKLLEEKIKEFYTSLRKGNNNIKESYKEIIDGFQDLDSSFNNKKGKDESLNRIKEYLDLQYSLSKDDLILQLPIYIDNQYGNVNLIIPNAKKGINKKNMIFFINLNTESLGDIKFNLQVKNDRIYIDFEAATNEKILTNSHILKDRLNRIGYKLEELNQIDFR